MQYITFNNGVKIPQAGLGTYLLAPDDAQASVSFALDNGYKLVDTANAYVNERAVGRGMRDSSRAREEIFLETKLWPCFYESDTAVDETLERLGTDYIDLMILHQPAGDYLAGYAKLEAAYKAGKLRSIGISNFNEAEIENLLAHCEVAPALIQVECHPYFPQTQLKALLAKHDIALQAWYPLGGRDNKSILEEPAILELAAKHGKTAAQIIMRWHVQQDNIVIPGSKTPVHILDNIDIFDFELDEQDMHAIAGLEQGKPLYERTPDKIAFYATWHPDVKNQK
ncbi:aldo/keto reductase [uncultured Senegalimassilia sp.]|uniref:aldo/keto reductase n=1 Tax=uncultured Senegalimassilia sp. TaxID=1714350 RepID=UPI0027DDA42E|nr:aldo/keto reductase [uncultured Senegalimassilia sp.]